VIRLSWQGLLPHLHAASTHRPVVEIGVPLIATLMFLLALSSSIALAQDIPDYDSQAYCERVATKAAEPDAMRGRCLWLEEYALGELETFWPSANRRVREECVDVASTEESYAFLARCVMGRLGRMR
jgi:hypothetical protein